MHKPVFILGCTKSGTTLMRNLFDGHSQLFAVPFESHFFQNIKYWVSYQFRRTAPRSLSTAAKKQALFDWVDFINNLDHPVADGFVEGQINMEVMRKVLDEAPADNHRELSDAYVRAIYQGIHGQPMPEQLNFAEKSVENAEFAQDFVKLYPDARFVHILRNPYSNLVAIRRYMSLNRARSNRTFPLLKNALLGMYNSYYSLYRNQRFIDNYKVVIYDELIAEPEQTMLALADFLEIPFEPILTQPTILGEAWKGNSTSGKQYQKVSPVNLEKWKAEITPFEVEVVNELFEFLLKDYGFEVMDPGGSRWRKNRGESLKNYALNRLLWYYLPRF